MYIVYSKLSVSIKDAALCTTYPHHAITITCLRFLSLVHKVTVLPTLRFGSSLVDRYAGYAEIDFWPIAGGACAGASGSCGFV